MTRNTEIARLFEEYADLLEANDDEYRPRSYRRAAANIRDFPEPIEDLAAEGSEALQEIEGVGDSIAEKIIEYFEHGSVAAIDELRQELPVDMVGLTSVEGIGPKTVGDLYEALAITSLEELETAAREGRIREVSGYGEKTEANILANIDFAKAAGNRSLLGDARPVATEIVAYLASSEAVTKCALAGSLRRWRETIGDIDILAAGPEATAIVDQFLDWDTEEVIEAGSAKASIRSRGFRVDLRIVDPVEWGSALQYFTGSKDHNIRLRNWAIDRDCKVNEYGVFDVSEVPTSEMGQRVGTRIAGESEESVYEALDIEWMPPELREDRGEIDAAAEGNLPSLIETKAIRGDLHSHTDWSDGDESISAMIAAAAAYGHEYLCISDHASGPGVVEGMGLKDDQILTQLEAIRDAASEASIDVFAGIEANIRTNGEISIGDEVLDQLDLVIASPHNSLRGDGTDRLVAAIEHPAVDIIGHPSGRRLGQRPGLDLDFRAIATAAAAQETALEVNSNPHRLDLPDEGIKMAVETGAPLVINTDAHNAAEFDYLEYGIRTARRGWAAATDVINTESASAVRDFLA